MLSSLAAIVLAAAQPGPPGSVVSCILDRIPATLRADVVDEAGSGKGGPVRAAFSAAAAACAAERSWNRRDSERFEHLAAAWTVVSEASARLEANGIPPAIVLDWYRAQPRARRTGPGAEAIEGLVASLTEAGISRAVIAENGLPIGLLIGGLASIERIGGESRD